MSPLVTVPGAAGLLEPSWAHMLPRSCPKEPTPMLMLPYVVVLQIEFEWLRQFWFQGKRYLKCTDWWLKPMAKLEEFWRKMEIMVSTSFVVRSL